MTNEPHLHEQIERMAELEAKLKELGIAPEAINQVMGHIDEYAEIVNGIDRARDRQFHDDAYDVASEIKAASNKSVDYLERYLRKFAEYIAGETLEIGNTMADVKGLTIKNIVDHIAPMSNEDEEEDAFE